MIMDKEDDPTANQKTVPSRHYKYRVLKTFTLIAMWITLGIVLSFVGTTLVDFKENLNTDYESLGVVLVVRSVCYSLGGLTGCVLRDILKLRSQLISGIGGASLGLVTLLQPWTTSVYFFGALNAGAGISHGLISTVNNAMLLNMWGEKASMPMHFFHFGYGAGAFVGPFLVKSFLSVPCPSLETLKNSTYNNETLTNAAGDENVVRCRNSTDQPVYLQPSRLEIPFSIGSGAITLIGFMWVTFHVLEKYSVLPITEAHSPKPSFNLGFLKSIKCSVIKSFFFKFSLGMFIVYMGIVSVELVGANYLFTFAYEGGTGFTKAEATDLTSAYWGSYTLGRMSASFIAHFVSVKIMIFVETFGTLCCVLCMLFLGFSTKTGMWLSACLLAFFCGPCWPSGMAFADRYIPVNAFVVACTDTGASVGGAICSWIAGYFIDKGQANYYLYVASSGCALVIILLTTMQCFGQRRGDRHATATPV